MKVKLMALLAGFCLVVGLPLAAMAGPTPGGTSGPDGDGVEDAFDNCTAISNAAQKDADHDGCGDLCDGDFDQNGATGITDYGAFLSAYGSTTGQVNYNAAADMDCNGAIGITDYGSFLSEYGGAPGPSGITNAGRDATACP